MAEAVEPPRSGLKAKPPVSREAADAQGLTAQKPLGYVEQMNGSFEAVISGPSGVQVVHEGEVVGNQRIVKVSPDSVQLAAIEARRAVPGEASAAASASPGKTPSVSEGESAWQSPARPTPLGYVELADGKREVILADGPGVRLQPEHSGLPGQFDSGQQLALRAPVRPLPTKSDAQPQSPDPPPLRPARNSSRVQPAPGVLPQTQPEGTNPGVDFAQNEPVPEAPTEPASGPEASEFQPADAVGVVEKSDGEILSVFAQEDGIRLARGLSTDIDNVGLALNFVGPLSTPEGDSATEAPDRAPPDRSPPPGGQARSEADLSQVIENPEASGRGAPGEVRPWFGDLPGLDTQEQATFLDGLGSTGGKTLKPAGLAADAPPEPAPQAAREVSLPAEQATPMNQYLGYVEWASGRRFEILSEPRGIQLVDDLKPAEAKTAAPAGAASLDPMCILGLGAIYRPAKPGKFAEFTRFVEPPAPFVWSFQPQTSKGLFAGSDGGSLGGSALSSSVEPAPASSPAMVSGPSSSKNSGPVQGRGPRTHPQPQAP